MSSPALKSLEQFGAELFPSVDKGIQKVLAAIHLGYPQATKWIQTSLNTLQALHFISFGDPLVVDGVFGPKTFAAVVVLQAKAGLKTTGAVTEGEYAVINRVIAEAQKH
jgi:lysozyme family protein